METGIRTSEWGSSAVAAMPTVVCRDCQVRLTLEESEEHDCIATPQLPPSPTKVLMAKTASHAESFLRALLDGPRRKSSPVSVWPPEETPVIRRGSEKTSAHMRPTIKEGYDKVSPERIDRFSSFSTTATSTSTSSNFVTAAQPHHLWVIPPRGEELSPFRCTVGDVRVSSDQVAYYTIATATPTLTTSPVTVERRFREFYAFALQVYAMFTSEELWQRLPPKTYCVLRCQHKLTDGFLQRRRTGLNDFLRGALDEMVLGVHAQGSIAHWYVLRRFLNLPSTLTPTKDRSLLAAMNELKKHARQSSGWTVARRCGSHDTIFEKVAGSFPMVKRVTACNFPARAVFDMVMMGTMIDDGAISSSSRSSAAFAVSTRSGPAEQMLPAARKTSSLWAPFMERKEVIEHEDECTWTEQTIFKSGYWGTSRMQMLTRMFWRMDESGAFAIVMIPAEDSDWSDPRVLNTHGTRRVDCVLGGWLISPSHQKDGCSITWLMQANFGECDSRVEFTGNHGRLASFRAQRSLLTWAGELTHLLQTLETAGGHHA